MTHHPTKLALPLGTDLQAVRVAADVHVTLRQISVVNSSDEPAAFGEVRPGSILALEVDGHALALFAAALLVVMGLVAFGVDRTNIAISVATLLMVFILQNSQNRDAAALHVKLDEVITHLAGPRDDVAGIETKSHEEIEELHEELHGEVGAAKDQPRRDA